MRGRAPTHRFAELPAEREYLTGRGITVFNCDKCEDRGWHCVPGSVGIFECDCQARCTVASDRLNVSDGSGNLCPMLLTLDCEIANAAT